MKSRQELGRENEALRHRMSSLSEAVRRIGASPGADAALNEIAASARALTGARSAAIVSFDDAGRVEDFVTSGHTPDERREIRESRDRMRLFEHLRTLAAPVRLRDLRSYARSVGLATGFTRADAFLATPIRHRNGLTGTFSLAGKDGGEQFTGQDEEILVLFAAQAGTAVANARANRDRQRARADLEALIETLPVGVVVIGAGTGHPLSCNREARRIVSGLTDTGETVEELLPAVRCRFADGREAALDEFPAPVRAEPIVLTARSGKSVRTLIDATPITTGDGAVRSVVVAVRDLGPLDEPERRRVTFLEMVSEELRAPLSSIKGLAATVLGGARVVDPAEVRQFFRIIEQQADDVDGLIRDLLDAGRIEIGALPVAPELVEVSALVDHARRTFLGSGPRHILVLDLPPDLPRVVADEQRIVQVLNNLFSFAARNSPPSSPVRVTALHEGAELAISVSGEGRAAASGRLAQLFREHASVGGPGLALCKRLVEAHGGRIRADSPGTGQGTRITFTLPVVDHADRGTPPRRPRQPRGRERTGVLVVDDDPAILRIVRAALVRAGFAPTVTGDPQEVARLISTRRPQLVLLDLVFPGTDGIELMQSVPALTDVPVIFISGYGRDETIARALEAGAADYIVKPFSATELTARVRAALRKRARPDPFQVADLAIDYELRRVTVAGRTVRLTVTEYELLRVLSVNAGRVLNYDSLIRQIWGERVTGNSEPVRTFVKKLRGKLGDDPVSPTYIFNERGVGYRMAVPADR